MLLNPITGAISRCGDRAPEQVRILVGHQERIEDRAVELICRQTVGTACLRTVAMTGEARVVAIPIPVARSSADITLAASGASDKTGQEVVGATRGAL